STRPPAVLAMDVSMRRNLNTTPVVRGIDRCKELRSLTTYSRGEADAGGEIHYETRNRAMRSIGRSYQGFHPICAFTLFCQVLYTAG
ncbi:MAG: hypothetical protein M3365_10330, partial [Gemmatimonadota bacterium]|nr:hypothetical protein [Gemmatimonadota bacterium]